MGHTSAMEQLSARRMPVIVAHRDEDVRITLRMLLEDAGYSVLIAAEHEAALEAARDLVESAVVIFEMEPLGQAGAGFLELALLLAARRDAGNPTPQCAFVALTTSPERLARPLARLMRSLDMPLIAEPFEMDDLLRTISLAASQHAGTPSGAARVAAAAPAPHKRRARHPRR